MITTNENDNIKINKPKSTKSRFKKVFRCFGPSLVLEHIFGIFRFGITDGKLVPTTASMKLFSLIMTTAVAIVFVVSLDVPEALSRIQNVVDVINDFPSFVIMVQYLSSTVMTSCLLSATNIRIMTSLADLDSTLHINTSKDFYRKSKNHANLALAIILLVDIISSTWDFLLETIDDNSVLNHILNYIVSFVKDLEILVFYLMVTMLKSRLKVINNYLVKIIHHDSHQDKISVFTIRQKNTRVENKFNQFQYASVNLHDLSMAYDTIGETCWLVNNVYNFQIFMALISAFVYVVITLWTSLYYFRTQVYSGNLVAIILWCCTEMLTVASMAFVCETLLSTRSDTKVLVNELVMDYELPAAARAQAKAFLALIDAWPLRIYVYDMFTVDVTLLLKFISVSTTYLIVITQIYHFV